METMVFHELLSDLFNRVGDLEDLEVNPKSDEMRGRVEVQFPSGHRFLVDYMRMDEGDLIDYKDLLMDLLLSGHVDEKGVKKIHKVLGKEA